MNSKVKWPLGQPIYGHFIQYKGKFPGPLNAWRIHHIKRQIYCNHQLNFSLQIDCLRVRTFSKCPLYSVLENVKNIFIRCKNITEIRPNMSSLGFGGFFIFIFFIFNPRQSRTMAMLFDLSNIFHPAEKV